MIAITLKKSALAQSSDIHYKLVIEVQGTSMHLSLHLRYNVLDNFDSSATVVLDWMGLSHVMMTLIANMFWRACLENFLIHEIHITSSERYDLTFPMKLLFPFFSFSDSRFWYDHLEQTYMFKYLARNFFMTFASASI